jgi:hypothetical protein
MHATLPATWRLPALDWRLLVQALVGALALGMAVHGVQTLVYAPIDLFDATAYWSAGERIMAGAPLYPILADPTAVDVYRYAPWFALLWAPATLLPREAVFVAWGVIVTIASVAVLLPLRRGLAGWCLIGLMLPFLAEGLRSGNVNVLIVLGLMYALPHRTAGPIGVALAASLKIAPLAFALVYLGRRDWRSFGITVGVTILLWAPAPLLGMREYSGSAWVSDLALFPISPVLWALSLTVAVGVTPLAARTRFAWLAGAACSFLAFPYPQWTYPSLLLVGLTRPRGSSRR